MSDESRSEQPNVPPRSPLTTGEKWGLVLAGMFVAGLLLRLSWAGAALGVGLVLFGQAIANGTLKLSGVGDRFATWARVTGAFSASMCAMTALGFIPPPEAERTAALVSGQPQSAPAAVSAENAKPPAPRPPAPTEASRTSEFDSFAPAELPGFALIEVERHPKLLPGMPEQPQTGVKARYAAREGGARAELLVERNSEGLSEGRKVMLGKVRGAIAADGDIIGGTAVEWRSGAMAGVLWYYPESASDKGRMRKAATTLATAAAAWTERVASGAMFAAESAANIAAVGAAVSSDAARELAAKEKLRVVASYLPKIVDSVSVRGNELIVAVRPAWHFWPRATRAEEARKMWKTWAMSNSPGEPDKSYLRITDGTGKKIGGSGMMGSSIHVDDD